MDKDKVLLILATNPIIQNSLQFDKEIKEIEDIFDKKRIPCSLKVVHELAVDWRSLQKTFAKYKPFILHFIGHGSESGITLHSVHDEFDIGYTDDLLRLVGVFSEKTKCIFFNSCNSYVTAQIISQKIDYAIGIEGEINDMLAIEFALAFYDAISVGNEIESSFEFAMVTYLRYESIYNCKINNSCPHLYKKGIKVNKTYDEKQISPSRLPNFSVHFVGRDNDLRTLTEAWNDKNTNVFVLEAWGGVGKTTLVSRWRTYFVENEEKSIGVNVFDWTFHRQGGLDSKPYTSEDFMDCALNWFQVCYRKDSSPIEKGQMLAKAVQQSKVLFILDGVESVQDTKENTDSLIMDDAVRIFICSLAEYNPGLCVITTRKHITELNKYEGVTCKTHLLKNLDYRNSTALLKLLGTYATDAEYRNIYDDYKGHPLSISLLGAYVHDNLDGRLDASEFKLFEEDKVKGNYAYKIMKYYDDLYKNGCQLELLRMLSLFDRAISYSELQVILSKSKIDYLTDKLPPIFSVEWGALLRQLKNAQLIMEYRIGKEVFLELHPMIREYYIGQLEYYYPDSFREGNQHLSDYYITMAETHHEECEKMNYYFRAVIHGCKAGAYSRMYLKVYLPFIKRYEIAHDARMYGGYGTNLDVISSFFKEKWSELYENESEEIRADLFAEAAFALMCLGENDKAIEPLKKAIELEYRLKNYKKLATYYGNLSEIYLLLGKIKSSLGISICGIGISELSDEIGRHNWAQMTKCANVLNQMGKMVESQRLFEEAELIQRKYDKNSPNLYGILAYKSYDVTLSYLEDMLIYKRLNLTDKTYIELDILTLEKNINIAIEHDQEIGNSLHLGAVYISSVRLKLIQYIVSGKGNFEEIGKTMSMAMQFINRGGRKEYTIYALLTYGKYYGIFYKEEKAEAFLKEAKDLATHYNFGLANMDIDIELMILKMQHDKYEEAQSIYDEIVQYSLVNTYGKRLGVLNEISSILKREREEKNL